MEPDITNRIDCLFNAHKIRYENLLRFLNSIEISGVITKINIFINIESILHQIHKQPIEESLSILDKKEFKNFHLNLTSNVLNLIAHYRRFFNKHQIKTNIVLFMNEYNKYSQLNNSVFIKSYRERFLYNYIDNPAFSSINKVLSILIPTIKTIINFIEDVYLITVSRYESSVVPILLCNEKQVDGQLNIIITRDMYDFQYVNKNFIILYPRSEESRIVIKETLFDFISDRYEIDKKYNLPSYIFPFALSIVGDKRRSIDGIKGWGWKTVYKEVSKLFKSLDIDNSEVIPLESLITSIKESKYRDYSVKEKIARNLVCTDVNRQYKMLTNSQKLDTTKEIFNKFEPDALKNLNDNYFVQNPIDVIGLEQFHIKEENMIF